MRAFSHSTVLLVRLGRSSGSNCGVPQPIMPLATSSEVGPRRGWATRVPGSAEPRPVWREMQIRPSSMLPTEGGLSVQAPSSLSLQLECWFYFCILWAWERELISLVQYGPLEKVLSKDIFLTKHCPGRKAMLKEKDMVRVWFTGRVGR